MSITVKRYPLVNPEEINTIPGREFFTRKTEKFFDSCKVCNGTCSVAGDPKAESLNGKVRHACPECSRYARRMRDFCNKFFFSVPPRFHHCIWSELQPSSNSVLPLDTQMKHMDYLSHHPFESVAIFGPAGTGKTTWLTAMYAQQCWWETGQNYALGGRVYYLDTKVLLDQFTRYSLHNADRDDPADPPRWRKERIDDLGRKGAKIHLFLEEIDKIKQTDARITNLWEVVNAIYNNYGQLVFTSNLTPEQFLTQFGDVFFRRIIETSHFVNLFSEKK